MDIYFRKNMFLWVLVFFVYNDLDFMYLRVLFVVISQLLDWRIKESDS